jgi:Uma2 family endonuclease
MGRAARKFDTTWSYADYLTWEDGQRWEIINGEAYAMTPGPSFRHQSIALRIGSRLERFFSGKGCTPFMAPFDVVFNETNVVQPDLFVVCDRNKITDANVTGAPDLIIEILSPTSLLRDRREKMALYERFGVREYLIIHPLDETVEQYLLIDGRYGAPKISGWMEPLTFGIFPELTLNLWDIFDKELPVEAPVNRRPMLS